MANLAPAVGPTSLLPYYVLRLQGAYTAMQAYGNKPVLQYHFLPAVQSTQPLQHQPYYTDLQYAFAPTAGPIVA